MVYAANKKIPLDVERDLFIENEINYFLTATSVLISLTGA